VDGVLAADDRSRDFEPGRGVDDEAERLREQPVVVDDQNANGILVRSSDVSPIPISADSQASVPFRRIRERRSRVVFSPTMATSSLPSPNERNARTQNAFRNANEAITEVGGSFGLGEAGGEPMQVMCECGRADCCERIELSKPEYERIRSNGIRFVLVAGHEVDSVEHVVYRAEGYVVAENHGGAAAIARRGDPRRP
jgi:hypothetical protein